MFAIYGTTYGAGNGSTTFNLPDFRNRTIWGAENFGYIEAGLPNIKGAVNIDGQNNTSSGAITFSGAGDLTDVNNVGGNGLRGVMQFDASRSSSIYGKSPTVQPPAIKVRVVTRYK